jgi:hypothetical protein
MDRSGGASNPEIKSPPLKSEIVQRRRLLLRIISSLILAILALIKLVYSLHPHHSGAAAISSIGHIGPNPWVDGSAPAFPQPNTPSKSP